MPSEAVPLGSVCSIKQGKYLAPTEMSESLTSSSPIPVIGGNGVLGYTSRPSHSRDVVLVTCRGSRCGLLQWVKAPVWVSNNAMACDAGSDEANLLLRYALASVSFDDVTTGSAQPQITVGHLSAKLVTLPERHQWRKIVNVLKSLDDRIDLLRQTNATLESIAQALFKSWFIDFDPVRAKAEGREPDGMDAVTAALFPAEFEESALGLIPKGWRIGTLTDAFEVNPNRKLSKGTDAKYLEMANAPTSGHRPLERVGLRAFGSGCKFQNGDALLAKITPCLENGKSAFVDFLEGAEVGWGSTEFIVLRSKPVLPEYGAYLMARHEPFRQFAIQAMTGTSGRQRVDISRLMQYPLALPSDASIARALEPMLQALQARIAANDEQAKVLADARNTLLPYLISGKLRLPVVTRALEPN